MRGLAVPDQAAQIRQRLPRLPEASACQAHSPTTRFLSLVRDPPCPAGPDPDDAGSHCCEPVAPSSLPAHSQSHPASKFPGTTAKNRCAARPPSSVPQLPLTLRPTDALPKLVGRIIAPQWSSPLRSRKGAGSPADNALHSLPSLRSKFDGPLPRSPIRSFLGHRSPRPLT